MANTVKAVLDGVLMRISGYGLSPKFRIDVTSAMEHPSHLDTIIDGTVENHIMAKRETSQVNAKLWAGASHEGLSSEEQKLLMEGIKEAVCGRRGIFGDVESSVIEVLARQAVTAHGMV
jgi:hypothetical protein